MESEIKLNIPENVKLIIKRLTGCGYEACVVGGCVRDSLLGREPGDWDVASSAPPDKMLELFSSALCGTEFHSIPTGLAHGTVTVISLGVPVEVTSYRIDGGYSDCRRPDSVMFTGSLADDLARRDFTVNSMAYSPELGLVDLYGGFSDLKAGIIRCVGSPEKRFSEDALRILRALRFGSVLVFEIESATAEAIFGQRGLLTKISRERVGAELAKILTGKGAAKILTGFRAVFETILPELCGCADFDAAAETVLKLNREKSSVSLLLAALLSEIPPEKVYGALNRLRFDKKTCRHTELICTHLSDCLSDKKSVRRLCYEAGTDTAGDIIKLGLIRAGIKPGVAISPYCSEYIREIRENNECVSISALNINGSDLLALGAEPEKIGGLLARLLEHVMFGDFPNETQELICLAEKMVFDYSYKENGDSL